MKSISRSDLFSLIRFSAAMLCGLSLCNGRYLVALLIGAALLSEFVVVLTMSYLEYRQQRLKDAPHFQADRPGGLD